MANRERSYRYHVVDVFTDRPLEGNALAVFPDAEGLDDATMQKIAREMNLAETAFVLKATRGDCAASVRIFTPFREMRFAGHPTVGTSFVLLDEGIVPRDSGSFVLEEKVGPVPIRVEEGPPRMIWLTTPKIEAGPPIDRSLCAHLLGLSETELLGASPQVLSAGNPSLFIPLKSQQAVDRAQLDANHYSVVRAQSAEPVCIFVFTPTPTGAYSRMFAPEHGVVEDPATGSATGPLAYYMMQHSFVPTADGTRFFSEQGTKMGRRSILHVAIRGENGKDGIDVGGEVTPLVKAVMTL